MGRSHGKEINGHDRQSDTKTHLNDADYNQLKDAADREGTELEAWLLNTVRRALAEAAAREKNRHIEDANGWPAGFFETTYGSLADDPLERQPQLEPEIREAIR